MVYASVEKNAKTIKNQDQKPSPAIVGHPLFLSIDKTHPKLENPPPPVPKYQPPVSLSTDTGVQSGYNIIGPSLRKSTEKQGYVHSIQKPPPLQAHSQNYPKGVRK